MEREWVRQRRWMSGVRGVGGGIVCVGGLCVGGAGVDVVNVGSVEGVGGGAVSVRRAMVAWGGGVGGARWCGGRWRAWAWLRQR